MKPNLLHPLRDRSHERAERRGHERRTRSRRVEARQQAAEPAAVTQPAGERDPAVERARMAGGPLDTAVYTCGCGYLFDAPVSTTVACPHCGCDQAW